MAIIGINSNATSDVLKLKSYSPQIFYFLMVKAQEERFKIFMIEPQFPNFSKSPEVPFLQKFCLFKFF